MISEKLQTENDAFRTALQNIARMAASNSGGWPGGQTQKIARIQIEAETALGERVESILDCSGAVLDADGKQQADCAREAFLKVDGAWYCYACALAHGASR